VLTDLFRCRACRAKDQEIERLVAQVRWAQDQMDLQNRRLAEIAAPRTNERVAASLRQPRTPPPPRVLRAEEIPPMGFEVPPEPDFVIVDENRG